METYIQGYRYIQVENESELTALYKSLSLDYPKFYKMDGLSKIGFLCSEYLLVDKPHRFEPRKDRGIICFNSSASLENDTHYEETIKDAENFFPSPSLFVYTLPNILTGEIAIRNKYLGESSFYISRSFDAEMIYHTVTEAFQDEETNSILVGWTEYYHQKKEALMMLISREKNENEEPFSVSVLKYIMKREHTTKQS